MIYSKSLLTRRLYSEAIKMYSKTLMNVKMLIGVLSNTSLVALYSHAPVLKLRDAALMLLLVYIGIAYCFQRKGRLEETMYSMQEAEFVARDLLPDSLEASVLVNTLKQYLVTAVEKSLTSFGRSLTNCGSSVRLSSTRTASDGDRQPRRIRTRNRTWAR